MTNSVSAGANDARESPSPQWEQRLEALPIAPIREPFPGEEADSGYSAHFACSFVIDHPMATVVAHADDIVQMGRESRTGYVVTARGDVAWAASPDWSRGDFRLLDARRHRVARHGRRLVV